MNNLKLVKLYNKIVTQNETVRIFDNVEDIIFDNFNLIDNDRVEYNDGYYEIELSDISNFKERYKLVTLKPFDVGYENMPKNFKELLIEYDKEGKHTISVEDVKMNDGCDDDIIDQYNAYMIVLDQNDYITIYDDDDEPLFVIESENNSITIDYV